MGAIGFIYLATIYFIAKIVCSAARKSVANSTSRQQAQGAIASLIVRVGFPVVLIVALILPFLAAVLWESTSESFKHGSREDYVSCILHGAPSVATDVHARILINDCQKADPRGYASKVVDPRATFVNLSSCLHEYAKDVGSPVLARALVQVCQRMVRQVDPYATMPQSPRIASSAQAGDPPVENLYTYEGGRLVPYDGPVVPERTAATPDIAEDAQLPRSNTKNPKYDVCYAKYLKAVNSVPEDAPLGDYTNAADKAKRKMDGCLR